MPVFVLLNAIGWIAGLVPWMALAMWWLKPVFDRIPLFVLSRAVFGEATHWGDLWRARRQVLGGQLLRTLAWRRFSPWRAYTQPIEQLEGQRGGEAEKLGHLLAPLLALRFV